MTGINRTLQIVNFLGVAALAGLCVAQWKDNSRLVAAAGQLEQVRQQQAAKIAEQARSLQDAQTQLDDVHQRLSQADDTIKAKDASLQSLTQQRDTLLAKGEQDRAVIGKWQAALSQRDEALRKAAEQLQTLARQRDEAIRRSNSIVAQYNQTSASGNNGQAAAH